MSPIAQSSPTLNQLASTISSAASTVTNYLQENGHPQPSFLPDGPIEFPSAPLEVSAARVELLTAARQLLFLAQWPREAMQFNICAQHHDSSTLQWLYHFKIFAAVPSGGKISFSELASQTGLEEKQLTRIVRYAMTNFLFFEPEAGYVSHTAQSALLAKDVALSGFVGHCTEEVFPASAKLVEATELAKSGGSQKTRDPFNLAFDSDLNFLEFMGKDPVRSERFAECMKGLIQSKPWSVSHVVNGYDWKSLGEAVVVDLGGSTGHVSKAIAASAPQIHFVIQDQAEVIKQGIAELDPELTSRFTFTAHDFFTPNPQPLGSVDVFFMRFILHDWPTSDSIRILQNLVPSMVPEKTKIVICDSIVPEHGESSYMEERGVRIVDMQMMTIVNAAERTVADWDALFEAVGLRMVTRSKPSGSALSFIEAVLPILK